MTKAVPFGETAPAPAINIETGLITSVLDTGDMKSAVTKKITGEFILGPDKPVWEFMLQHYREFKKAPELPVINRKFPDWKPVATNEPVDYFISELQSRQRYNLILKGMKEISQGLNAKNSDQAYKDLVKLVSKINTEVQIHRDSLWNEEIDERIARMEARMRAMGVDGISYGVDAMDQATGGMHPEELITIVGKPGTGKTYFELGIIARSAMLEGENVLFISREMAGWQIEQRMDALMFEIPGDNMKLGRFTTEEFEVYKENLRSLKDRDLGRLIVSADDEKGFGLTAVQAKIEEHLPDGGVVIIDGSYLLDDDEGGGKRSDWEKIVSITRGLKRMARRTGCTIVQSSQLGRGQKRGKSVDLDNVSFSSSFEQDSDVVWGLYQTDEMKAVGKMGVEGAKVREGDNPRLILNWNFDTMKDFGKLAEDITDAPDDDEDVIVY
jgi:replicative DNA helicase